MPLAFDILMLLTCLCVAGLIVYVVWKQIRAYREKRRPEHQDDGG